MRTSLTCPFLFALLLPLAGCLINTELYEQRLDELTDDDGDGFREDDGDCNDNRPDVYPGAPEICDGRDNDCNGKEDDKPVSAWYLDADNDGHGDPSTAQYICRQPEGHVAQGDDCDDGNAEAFPGLNERCDGWDNDCNGEIDEASAVDARTWYPDEDGDGFGDSAYEIRACDPPTADSVEQGGDCDDTNPFAWPDAPELCDGLDNDCDGMADEPPVSGSGSWYRDRDGDGYGDDAETACVGGEGYVEVGGDCDDDELSVHPGAEEICNDGLDNDCDGGPGACTWASTIDITDEIVLSSPNQREYFAERGTTGDLDGDGATEILLSSFSYMASAGQRLGQVLFFEAPLTASASRTTADLVLSDESYESGFGYSMASSDFDGDGYDDLLVSNPDVYYGSLRYAGEIYLIHGPLTHDGVGPDLADWTLYATGQDDSLGYVLREIGDIDGDGQLDFASSYPTHSYAADRAGAVWLFTTLSSGTSLASSVATAFLYGTDEDEHFGDDFAGADLNADGRVDLVVGSSFMSNSDGGVRIWEGPIEGTLPTSSADISLVGESDVSLAGRSLDAPGDLNGDGVDDLVVAASQAGYGTIYITWGSSSLSDGYLADAEIKIRADATTGLLFGHEVRGVGDLDADGSVDLAVAEGSLPPGDVFLFFGPFDTPGTRSASTADVILEGDDHVDSGYELLLGPGDITGDAAPDLVVGCPWGGANDNGVAYIIPGTTW